MAAEVSSKYAVQMHGITKRFGSFYALTDVDLDVEKGTIHSILGENGAGKSTLMNVLYGLYQADMGEIYIGGKKVDIKNPTAAIEHGIGMVHQHFMLVENFTVTQNIVLGSEPTKSGITLNMKQARKNVLEIVEKYGLDVNPDAKIRDITVGMQQRVEILKALYRGAEILILDEPTAVLTEQEIDELLAIMRNLIKDGKTIIIITHKLKEIQASSDMCTIIRRGHYIDTVPVKGVSEDDLATMMVGHAVTLNIDRPDPVNPKPRVEVNGLTVRSIDGILKLDDVSFTAYSGEILGIAGISGCGQKELLESIAGLQPVESGSISYIEDDGTREELIGKDPLSIAEMGVSLSFVPEDRLGMGLVANMDLADNMMLRSFRRGHSIFTDRRSPKELAEAVVQNLEVSTPGIFTPVRRLSGGNVQKVLVGREIASAPTVLLTAYAVRGLDINSSYTIYDLINKQKAEGVAVIYVGEDLDVLLELADRILVLCGGKVSGIVPGRGSSKREVGLMMTKLGGHADE